MLVEDLKIRQYVFKTLPQAAISKVVIERPAKLCRVSIYAARPGVIIGKQGADIEKLRKKLGELKNSDVSLNIRSEEHTSELQSLMRSSYAVFCLKQKTHHIS